MDTKRQAVPLHLHFSGVSLYETDPLGATEAMGLDHLQVGAPNGVWDFDPHL